MKLCPNCNSQVPDAASFCTNCGASLNEMTTCPGCGKMVMSGTKFCMYCGARLSGTPQPQSPQPQSPQPQSSQPLPTPPKKSTNWGARIIGFLALVFIGTGGYFAYSVYSRHQAKIRQQEEEARELAIADSLEEVRYEEQLKMEKLKEAEEHRIEDLTVFISSLYSLRGEYGDKIVKHYSDDLRSAYRSWHREDLSGPQPLFYDKKWNDGCSKWVIIRNFKKEVAEAESPTDSIATFKVDVNFALYSAKDDEPYLESDSHRDEFHLIYEHGEWKVDDLIRDGKSSKQRYRDSSSDFGREICE